MLHSVIYTPYEIDTDNHVNNTEALLRIVFLNGVIYRLFQIQYIHREWTSVVHMPIPTSSVDTPARKQPEKTKKSRKKWLWTIAESQLEKSLIIEKIKRQISIKNCKWKSEENKYARPLKVIQT